MKVIVFVKPIGKFEDYCQVNTGLSRKITVLVL